MRFYAPENALALLGWELTNEAEALAPGAECAAMAWRRPTAADAARAGAGSSALPPALAVGLAWYDDATDDRRPTSRSDARVLTYDEGSMRWRVSAVLFEAGAGAPPASALAWAPNADASPSGSAETVAAERVAAKATAERAAAEKAEAEAKAESAESEEAGGEVEFVKVAIIR